MLKKANLLENFTMIHFHIGSQISEIHPLKKALIEAGNIYAELRKMGAMNLKAINLARLHQRRRYARRECLLHSPLRILILAWTWSVRARAANFKMELYKIFWRRP